ncbi:MAG: hypothetical protein JXA98_00330 [Methanosarcinaceae archaeon]|nr:hypothetical protein [Methanosarcinaceae archaeon]
MKPKIRFGMGALLAAMLLVSMALVPMVSAKEMQDVSVESEEKQIEIVNQLWGQKITIGEYMEKVHPNILKKMPQETLEYYYATEMVWPDLSEQGSHSCESTAFFDPSSNSQDSLSILDFMIWSYDSEMDVTGSNIDFSSWSKILYPPYSRVPSMTVFSYLWYDDGNSQTIVEVAYEHETNVYKLEASDSYSADSAGNYRAAGSHYIVFPPGYNPPEWYGTSSTNWVYISP